MGVCWLPKLPPLERRWEMSHRRKATDAEMTQAAHALVSAVVALGVASTDDAHARYELPASVDQRAWGAVTTRLIADGLLVRSGDTHTRRGIAHGRRIGRYYCPHLARARQYAESMVVAAPPCRAVQRVLPGMG